MILDDEHVTSVYRARSRGHGLHIFRYHCSCGRRGDWEAMEMYTRPARLVHEQAMNRLAGPADPIMWRRRPS